MEKNPYVVLFFLIFCSFVAKSHGKTQGDAIGKLYQAEFRGKFMQRSHFQTTDLSQSMAIANRNKTSSNLSKIHDKIRRLPGQPMVKFAQYGGYINVDDIDIHGKAFYYYFVEAENSTELPLLLWLNGGPGCSSLGFGALQEIGPFRVHSDGRTLYRNKYSWNNVANLLFMEFPIGVGFSYSNQPSDYQKYGDSVAAGDNYMFIVKWLDRFPEYKDRSFYISGESYAGHYASQLAQTILDHNKIPNFTQINLKGIMIGNAMMNHETDVLGMFEYFGSHALVSPETTDTIKENCNFRPNDSKVCMEAIYQTYYDTDDINIYNIEESPCTGPNLTATPKNSSLRSFDPCSVGYVYAYLNRVEVQAALHANVTKIPNPWEPCSDKVIDLWQDKPPSVLPLLSYSMSNGLRLWIYSGDNDARIPVTATQYSINKMNLTIKTQWYPWYRNGEIGGYAQEYAGDLTFATVRGAGHEVPSYQPHRALTLIKSFLNGRPLPSKLHLFQ